MAPEFAAIIYGTLGNVDSALAGFRCGIAVLHADPRFQATIAPLHPPEAAGR